MKKTWVVIANGSEARIYEAESKHHLSLVHTFSHQESRLPGRDLTSDRSGRVADSVGTGRHAMEEPMSAKEVEVQAFAAEIANYLDDARKHDRVERLYLSASPHFLGLIQKSLSKQAANMVVETIAKDFTHVAESELSQKIDIRFLG